MRFVTTAWLLREQGRRCAKDVTQRRVLATIVGSGKANTITYSECVFVASGIQHDNAHAPYCHLWPVRFNIFSILSHKRHDFGKEIVIEHKMCVLILSTSFDFMYKFWFHLQILILSTNFDFIYKFLFYLQILIFSTNFDFVYKFWFHLQILIFSTNFYFIYKFWFYLQTLILSTNFDFFYKFWFYLQILILSINFDFI